MENLPPIDSDADMVVVGTGGDAAAAAAAEGTGEGKTASDAHGPLAEADLAVEAPEDRRDRCDDPVQADLAVEAPEDRRDRRDDPVRLVPLPKYEEVGKHVSDLDIRSGIIRLMAKPSTRCPMYFFADDVATYSKPDDSFKNPSDDRIEAVLKRTCSPNWTLECSTVQSGERKFRLTPARH